MSLISTLIHEYSNGNVFPTTHPLKEACMREKCIHYVFFDAFVIKHNTKAQKRFNEKFSLFLRKMQRIGHEYKIMTFLDIENVINKQGTRTEGGYYIIQENLIIEHHLSPYNDDVLCSLIVNAALKKTGNPHKWKTPYNSMQSTDGWFLVDVFKSESLGLNEFISGITPKPPSGCTKQLGGFTLCDAVDLAYIDRLNGLNQFIAHQNDIIGKYPDGLGIDDLTELSAIIDIPTPTILP